MRARRGVQLQELLRFTTTQLPLLKKLAAGAVSMSGVSRRVPIASVCTSDVQGSGFAEQAAGLLHSQRSPLQ